MNAGQTIAKLEALLARVRSRAGEPRPLPRATAAAVAAPALALPGPDEPLDLEEEESDQPTLPPPPIVQAAPASPAAPAPASARPRVPAPSPAPALELSVDIDVSVEEPAVARAEEAAPAHPPVSEASSSQERLVAVEPVEPLAQRAPHAVPEEVGEPALEVSPQPAAEAAAPPPAAEEEEEAPVSSRRPLAPAPEERLAEMAFGAEEPRPPLHTPPPESGQLPAAPALEFADEDTGVRAAAPPAVIEPETTRVELGGSGQVAAIHGSVQAFHPTSFAELLDASLSL